MKILRAGLLLVLMVSILSISVRAQQSYTLVTPTVGDYLTTLKGIDLPDEESWQLSAFIAAVDHEFRLRYWESANYKALYEAFTLLKILIPSHGMGLTPSISYDTWIAKLVQTWLDENNPTWQ